MARVARESLYVGTMPPAIRSFVLLIWLGVLVGALRANETAPLPILMTPEEIAQAPYEQRTHVADCVAAALADDVKLLAREREAAERLGEPWSTRFSAAAREHEERAKQLRKAMRAAEHASDDAWTEARARLAAEFAEFTQFAARTHTLVAARHTSPVAASSTPQ